MRRFVILLIGLALVAAVAADQADSNPSKSKSAAELWTRIKENLQNLKEKTPDSEKLLKLISSMPGLGQLKHLRVKRNNFGDLPVKCGPNQEKIHGACQDV